MKPVVAAVIDQDTEELRRSRRSWSAATAARPNSQMETKVVSTSIRDVAALAGVSVGKVLL